MMSDEMETCWACDREHLRTDVGIPADGLTPTDSIALCNPHWSWWVARFLNSDELPPCGAHLANWGDTSGN